MAREGPAGKGRIMVALGSAPNSATLVGWASRMAGALGWEWLAVHVDPGHRLSHDDAERLDRNLALARRLGAEVLVLEAPEVASAIVDTARDRQVDLVVVGRSGLSRLGLLPRRPTISDRSTIAAASVRHDQNAWWPQIRRRCPAARERQYPRALPATSRPTSLHGRRR